MREWQVEDGLPDSTINTILQDRTGYLWVGTNRGLARFDGMRFLNFDSSVTEGLAGNRISCLMEDSAGNLWIGTRGGGISVYRGQRFFNIGTKVGRTLSVTAMAQDGAGKIRIATTDGGWWEAVISGSGAVDLRPSAFTGGLRSNGFTGIAGDVPLAQMLVRDHEGMVWGAITGGLSHLADGGWSAPVAVPGLLMFQAKRDGGLWLADRKGLETWSSGTGLKRLGNLPSEGPFGSGHWAKTIFEDHSGTLWLGTVQNGLLWRLPDGRWENPVKYGGLFQNAISCITEDRQGSIWIGTDNGGLYRLRERLASVLVLPNSPTQTNVLSLFRSHDGTTWIGTGGDGLYHCQDGALTHYGTDEGVLDGNVTAVVEDRHGVLWLGTEGGLFNNQGGKFHRVTYAGPMPKVVLSLFEDSGGRIWALGYGSFGAVGEDEGEVKWYTRDDGLTSPDVRTMVEDGHGGYWLGTVGGGLHHLKDGRLEPYKLEGLDCRNVVSLLRDREGTLWICTYEEGLAWIKDGKAMKVTTADGLASNIIGHLAEDRDGGLWATSVRGLMRIRKSDLLSYRAGQERPLAVMTFGVHEGMYTQPCSGGTEPCLSWDAEGRLWVPNMKAVAIVDVNKVISAEPERIPVLIEDLQVNGVDRASSPEEAAEIPYDRNRIDFHYASLDLAAAESVRFRYKLEGWDTEWVNAGLERVAHYAALPAGNYRFRMMAGGRSGTWTEAATPVDLKIVPRIWQRGWFLLSIGALVLGATAVATRLIYKKRVRRELDRLRQIHLVEQERVRIARDIHDELGASLAQIALLADMGEAGLDNSEKARRNLNTIARRSRSAVVSLDEIVWAVNPENDTLQRVVDYLCRMANEASEESPIRCLTDAPQGLPMIPVSADARHNLTLAVREAITNAQNHSGATEINLHVAWNAPVLSVEVVDNGHGFDVQSPGGHGNGLENQRARMKQIGGSVELESRPTGVRLIFRVNLEP